MPTPPTLLRDSFHTGFTDGLLSLMAEKNGPRCLTERAPRAQGARWSLQGGGRQCIVFPGQRMGGERTANGRFRGRDRSDDPAGKQGLQFRRLSPDRRRGQAKSYQCEIDRGKPAGVYGIGMGGWLFPKGPEQTAAYKKATKDLFKPKPEPFPSGSQRPPYPHLSQRQTHCRG